ncbi:MAG: glycosyltransferase family 2 protein [Planctomycetota bacterium]|nr:MAG: glycosyltransferase family 2 protein [Planctomycetota bacterium]
MQVLVAIPVFNEARYVARVVSDVRAQGQDVLVVDDGSTDDTPRILRGIGNIDVIRHPENRGYGQSLIDAFAYAAGRGYDWIITIDCDDQHEPERIPEFVNRAALDNVDIISGSRYMTEMPGSTDAPADRRTINRTITRLLNDRLGLALTDAFCGFKAYRAAKVAALPLTVPGYAFPMQFWVQAVRHCLNICELPVPLIYNDPTRHFGGILDDPDSRLNHYLEVFETEMARPSPCKGPRVRCGA